MLACARSGGGHLQAFKRKAPVITVGGVRCGIAASRHRRTYEAASASAYRLQSMAADELPFSPVRRAQPRV
jgi:hypothetical protein